MVDEGSVTDWLEALKRRDDQAVEQLWERYFARLVALASQKLRDRAAVADGEDAALSAFHSFCQRAADGRFPELTNREELWALLATVTVRKCYKQLQRPKARPTSGNIDATEALAALPLDEEPTPELAASFAEQFDLLLSRLPEESLRSLALLKLQGYTNEEIADRMDCVTRTVERKLRRIRNLWSTDEAPT